ncbi:bifunctional lysylphosphatidylglycerol flippase/synthetase MprF [Cohnella nanjingensis]|uniref:Phosphatidylglycerol lysyltransferase n=1 Tax=Cohnella nanjingensis TaxID=1387779 RepID=A0A7X0VD02_9BACL|nr:bifunctional lysylphosphatidylglycerol flippase/synthetase MprF [Cohnella nanjingensis]MBB6669472.1 bifunctional lysylphosphatidylglycerol flippase/synthetase MprF [Cohnella nanjingensis]
MAGMQKTLRSLKAIQLLTALYRLKIVQILIPIAIVGLIIWEGQAEFRRIDWRATMHVIRHLQPSRLLLLFAASLAAVGSVSGYEFVLRRHFRLPIGYWTTFRFAWIANTSNNVIGFAGIAGAALRMYLYRSRGISVQTITASIAFLSTITITGISLLAWADLVGLLPIGTITRAHPWTIYAVWALALYLPGYFLFQRTPFYAKWLNRDLPRMNTATIAASVGASLAEWLFSGIAFWMIAFTLLPGLSVSAGLGIYTVAAIAGLVSLAPGGIGGFDLVALFGLQALGYPPEKTAAVVVLFRILYYLVPWLIGLVMAVFEFASDRRKWSETGSAIVEGALNGWQRFWEFPGELAWISEFGAWALGKLVFISGAVLLLSAATPGLLYRLRFAEELLSAPIMRLSHQLSVIIGLILIVLSWGISRRLRRAYQWTLGLLGAGALFTFAKAFDYEEAIFLLIVAFLLYVSRARYYRVAAPIGRGRTAAWAIATLVISYLYDLIASGTQPRFVNQLPPNLPLHLILRPTEQTIAVVTGLGMTWLALSLALLLRPKRLVERGASQAELEKLRMLLGETNGNMLTHVLFAGDKSFFWACDNRVLFPYSVIRNKFVILGDPIGDPADLSEAIQECGRYADLYDLEVVFYQVMPANLPIYHENGYRFFKLGEEALVNLSTFTLSGKANANLRTVKNRFEREGYRLDVMQPPHDSLLLERLRLISNDWLNGRREKGFSLGWFHPAYLQTSPIAVLLDPDGRIVAFASLAPSYDGLQTISVDLMRHLRGTPNGTMDFLFICLLEWSRDQGYAVFNLGMAPLSSVGEARSAMREEKLANRVYEYGGYWYGFKGLRRYKEKFSPVWDPRYLAYPARVTLPILLVELIVLIARKPKETD